MKNLPKIGRNPFFKKLPIIIYWKYKIFIPKGLFAEIKGEFKNLLFAVIKGEIGKSFRKIGR